MGINIKNINHAYIYITMNTKNFKLILALCFSMTLATFYSCSNSGEGSDNSNPEETLSAYHCPMDCEGSDSEEAGECPVCGMDLEKR